MVRETRWPGSSTAGRPRTEAGHQAPGSAGQPTAPGALPAHAYLLLAAVTALIALIAAWTVAAAARDTLLPPPPTH
ncbi:hypothetical protein OG799_14795 [Micromonospora sp. NBC_00898]|uniref:hypothetical protein n=1 Tax=Micromonospora sp. NBC_00898 TaxID=2975981 RepID=UPI0038663758|nr:hypothetical protein OG799_14795 [Micromonospora sp. NBC_00898]